MEASMVNELGTRESRSPKLAGRRADRNQCTVYAAHKSIWELVTSFL